MKDKETKEQLTNYDIRKQSILLINEDGTKERLSKKDAIIKAESMGLDLVCVAEKPDFAICKIQDYNKIRYNRQRAQREARKNQSKTKTHQVQLSANTADGDIRYRAKQATEWLLKKDIVEIQVLFKGRMITHQEYGVEKINKLIEFLTVPVKIVTPVNLNGRFMTAKIALDNDIEIKSAE